MSEHEYCCDKFAANTGNQNIGFEYADGWNVNGCCGGGCYVLIDLKYCPYCAEELKDERKSHTDRG